MWARGHPLHVATLPRPVICGAALRAGSRGVRMFAVDGGAGSGGRQGDAALRAVPRTRRE